MRAWVGAGLLVAALAASAQMAGSPTDSRRSGLADMSPATQALQKDDTQNPGMLWVADGMARWSAAGSSGPSCSSCHGDAKLTMRGVAARYPAWDPSRGRAVSLAQRIQACRRDHQRQPASPGDDNAVLSLTAFVAHQSRGQAISPPADTRLDADAQRGQRLWQQPLGQLGLSCAMCHERLAGQRLAGSVIPQGHPTAYPLYRLEWQSVGSLQRRLRNCMVGVRAEPFAADAQEWVSLEVFLMRRAAGMPLETPGVRP